MPLLPLKIYTIRLAEYGLLLCVFLLLGFTCSGSSSEKESADTTPSDSPIVILVSIDGFRWDYLDIHDAPTLQRLAREGVQAEALIPSFPTKTFPNHYTIVTGLYPENHGIVANTMYDPEFDASFSLGNRAAVADGRWWQGEPIWVTAEKQGLKSAPYFWPGSEAEIKGLRPSYWEPYDGQVSGEARVDRVLSWLDLPLDDRPSFLSLYFSDVDSQGHRFGPTSTETAEAIKVIDSYLSRLIEGLSERNLLDVTNIIVVSDHGMTPTSTERVVILDDLINLEDVYIVDWDPILAMNPRDGKLDEVYQSLKQSPHLSAYLKEDIPDTLHYQNHRRIPSIIGIANDGWSITSRAAIERNPQRFNGGSHGYDNRLEKMGALFIAHGPAFKKAVKVGPFANIHIYNLMAHVLGLYPASNDGDLESVKHLLRQPVSP